METKFNFNSQICTDRFQSERLLALGLKKETADMAIEPDTESIYEAYYYSAYPPTRRGTPSWSLHRLLEMNLLSCDPHCAFQFCVENIDNAYEFLVDHIEWLIKEGYFNEDFLV